MTSRIILALLAPALVALALPFQASAEAPFVFQTDMYGGNHVPPVTSIAWGFVRFFFSEDRLRADYTVDVKGYSGTLVEGADLHRGQPGTNGPVVRHLADGGFIVTAGRLELTPAELEEFVAGEYYVSLKTKGHPEGELRGQVVVPDGFAKKPEAAPAPVPARSRVSEDAPPTGISITPPNTGDAGLAASAPETGGATRLAPVLVALAGAAAVAVAARRRSAGPTPS